MTEDLNERDMKERLFAELERARFGMLGLSHSDKHFQPMTLFTDTEKGQLWFFSPDNSELAKTIGDEGKDAMFILTSDDHSVHACIGGHAVLSHDPDRIDRYWTESVEAWFPEGKDDPHLTLIRMDLSDAEMWLTDISPTRYALELGKANAIGRKPDVGEHKHLDLH